MPLVQDFKFFDSHFHIIDPAYPLVENQGFLPDYFTINDYLTRLANYQLAGGTVVSGSFQGMDQSYLKAALKQLGPNYVGVTQLPYSVTDEEILTLNEAGIRGVRFNLKRGVGDDLSNLESFGKRIFDLAGWHIELYVDSREIPHLQDTLLSLPSLSMAHLGLSKEGFPNLLKLVEHGVMVKATGFGRVDFAIAPALRDIVAANPAGLTFGSDLPSTRTPHPYADDDFLLVIDTFGAKRAQKIFFDNAWNFYHSRQTCQAPCAIP